MERLTRRSDTGHAYYPRCFEEPCNGNGCKFKDCPFDETICKRLAAYEDTELTPEEVSALIKDWLRLCTTIRACGGIDRLRVLAEADKDGRVAVLPVGTGGAMLDTSYPENPRLIKRVHFAVAYVSEGIVFHQPYNIFLENIAAGYISPLSEEEEKALEALKNGN